jgi:sugar phosphate isomerase/epimerase
MKIGILTDPTRPLDAELAWAAEHGFDVVDVDMSAPAAALERTDWRAIGATARAHALSLIAHAAAYLPVENPSPLVRQAALDELRRSIDAAKLMGAPLLTTRFRGWPAHLDEQAGYEYTRQLYGILVKHGQEQGVAVALENSADNSHQLKFFREIFQRIPDLKLHLNIGHGHVDTAQSMTRHYLFALADRVVHVHISDNDGSSDARLPFGATPEGIDLLRELQALRSFNYDAAITLDMAGDRRWQLACADLLREVWPQAE